MRLVCPSCGAIHSAEAWENDADARRCLGVIQTLPAGTLRYLALFRLDSGRGLSWRRAVKVMEGLQALTSPGWVKWDKSPARPCPLTLWQAGIEKMLACPPRQLPLANHHYLTKIVYQLADETDRAIEIQRNAAERRNDISGVRINREPQRLLTVEEMRAIRERNMKKTE